MSEEVNRTTTALIRASQPHTLHAVALQRLTEAGRLTRSLGMSNGPKQLVSYS